MCGWGELEDSIDWTSIFKLQLVFLCPYLKKGSCDILFLSLEGKYILHSSIIAYMQLSKFCPDIYVQSSLQVTDIVLFFFFFFCVLKWSFSLMASTVGFFPCLTLSLEAGIKWCLCTGVLAVGVGDLCLKFYLKQIFSGLLGTPVGSH